jgi:thiamine pyrophosphate-dependent acetolactate synthase large subunit-like protein
VFDAGRFSIPALKFLHAPNPYAWVPTLDFASIGLGVPTAIGASFGRPGHPVLVVTGDGGFMLGGLAEFNTAVRHHVDLIVAVLNDGAYGAELRHLRNYELGTELSQFNWPDFADVAAALGGEAATVSCPADLEKLSDVIENRRGPLLIDIKLDPLHVPAPEDG